MRHDDEFTVELLFHSHTNFVADSPKFRLLFFCFCIFFPFVFSASCCRLRDLPMRNTRISLAGWMLALIPIIFHTRFTFFKSCRSAVPDFTTLLVAGALIFLLFSSFSLTFLQFLLFFLCIDLSFLIFLFFSYLVFLVSFSLLAFPLFLFLRIFFRPSR